MALAWADVSYHSSLDHCRLPQLAGDNMFASWTSSQMFSLLGPSASEVVAASQLATVIMPPVADGNRKWPWLGQM